MKQGRSFCKPSRRQNNDTSLTSGAHITNSVRRAADSSEGGGLGEAHTTQFTTVQAVKMIFAGNC